MAFQSLRGVGLIHGSQGEGAERRQGAGRGANDHHGVEGGQQRRAMRSEHGAEQGGRDQPSDARDRAVEPGGQPGVARGATAPEGPTVLALSWAGGRLGLTPSSLKNGVKPQALLVGGIDRLHVPFSSRAGKQLVRGLDKSKQDQLTPHLKGEAKRPLSVL